MRLTTSKGKARKERAEWAPSIHNFVMVNGVLLPYRVGYTNYQLNNPADFLLDVLDDDAAQYYSM